MARGAALAGEAAWHLSRVAPADAQVPPPLREPASRAGQMPHAPERNLSRGVLANRLATAILTAARGDLPAERRGPRPAVPPRRGARPHSLSFRALPISPITPARKASTQTTKIAPCTIVTQAPKPAR